ncbi:MAG: 50S ribosomal protein L24 [Minisyncoccia bacterium]
MKLKKGDQVVVVSGKDKGKTGAIVRVFPQENKLIVEGVALAKRHLRKQRGQSGRIIEKSLPVNASNVMLLDPKEKKPTRVIRKVEEGKRVRVARKSGSVLA